MKKVTVIVAAALVPQLGETAVSFFMLSVFPLSCPGATRHVESGARLCSTSRPGAADNIAGAGFSARATARAGHAEVPSDGLNRRRNFPHAANYSAIG